MKAALRCALARAPSAWNQAVLRRRARLLEVGQRAERGRVRALARVRARAEQAQQALLQELHLSAPRAATSAPRTPASRGAWRQHRKRTVRLHKPARVSGAGRQQQLGS
jgi:hypothetical protein